MGILSMEMENQKLVTSSLREGYEFIEAKPVDGQGLTYLLAKEVGDNVHILVVANGKTTYEKEWKKGQLISLRLITDSIQKQVNGNINN